MLTFIYMVCSVLTTVLEDSAESDVVKNMIGKIVYIFVVQIYIHETRHAQFVKNKYILHRVKVNCNISIIL